MSKSEFYTLCEQTIAGDGDVAGRANAVRSSPLRYLDSIAPAFFRLPTDPRFKESVDRAYDVGVELLESEGYVFN